MVGLCFHFDEWHRDVWSGRPVDLDAYRYTAKAFEVDAVAVVNTADVPIVWLDEAMDCIVFSSLEEFKGVTAEPIIYVETPWSAPADAARLGAFEHPPHAWYVFGGTDGLPSCDAAWLTIPQEGRGALHPTHAAAVVMADRYLRSL